MKILITGVAGFIGFHLAKSILKDDAEVYGIDNLNHYYNVDLKHDRLNILSKSPNFKFTKCDLKDNQNLKIIFDEFRPDMVVNLAAQAGVRYSIDNPSTYIDSNIVGFHNVIKLCKDYNVEGLIYASSSSVYGGNNKIPFSEKDRVDNPISLYAASKKANELIAYSYSHLFNLNTTGLRFFTVYGPWGRPDMAMYIFADRILANKKISVYNHGKMRRDFTYIDDIVDGIKSAIDKNYACEVFNLGNNKVEELMDVVSYLENYLGHKAQIDFLPMQPGDIEESHADIEKSKEMLGFCPKINVDEGVRNFINWHKEYHST